MRQVIVITGLCLILFSGNLIAEDLILSGPLTIDTDTTFDNVTIQSGGILTADAIISVNNDMTIESGGVVTHSDRFEPGLNLVITGTLDIQSGGYMDLNARGLRGGRSVDPSIRDGECYDPTGVTIIYGVGGGIKVNGDSRGAGASYGGFGASTSQASSNYPYGVLESPQHLGSGGGGAGWSAVVLGGHGGGRATITAGSLIIDGTMRANGGNGGNSSNSLGGGGSGGGIYIDAGTITGSGNIESIGGRGDSLWNATSGSGSGGRIAIYYDTYDFTGNIYVRGGNDAINAAAGTIYLKDNAEANGELTLSNLNVSSEYYTPLMTDLSNFKIITLDNRGQLHSYAEEILSFTVEDSLSLTNTSVFILDSGVTMTITNGSGFDIDVESGGSLYLERYSALIANAVRVNSGSLYSREDISFPVASDFELSGGGTLYIQDSATFEIAAFDGTNILSGTVNIQDGSIINITSDRLTLASGNTLIKDGSFGVSDQIGDMIIESGANVTHSNRFEAGVVLSVTDTLDVQSGGYIDLNERGLRGGRTISSTIRDGECYDPTGVTIIYGVGDGYNVNGDSRGAGASYGGFGASTAHASSNYPYGVLESPQHLGSGGGGAGAAAVVQGGHGGGRATIAAGSFIIDGTMRANGGNGGNSSNSLGGGGSGGGIYIDVGTITGSGNIESIGGRGDSLWGATSGSGSGGRIAIYYDTYDFTGNIYARGGNDAINAAAGTIYLKDNAEISGDIYIDNFNVDSDYCTPILTNLSSCGMLIAKNHGAVGIVNELQIESELNIHSNGRIQR